NFIHELDTLLSLFPSSPLPFDLTLNPSPPTLRGGNTLDLIFSRPTPALDITAIPLHCSHHHFLSFTLQLFLSISPLHIPPSLGVTCAPSLPLLLLQPSSPPSTRSSPPAPWLTDVLCSNQIELRKAERKWRRSQLDYDLYTYQTLLSTFSEEGTTAKSSFYKRKLEESASKPTQTLQYPQLLPLHPFSLTPEYFVTFFDDKVNKIHDILQLLESSNPTTWPLDPIPSTLLQSISLGLLPFISFLINCSLSSGHAPQAFKTPREVPILKKPSLDTSAPDSVIVKGPG
ncbi:hypothetical protein NFI96_027961, partial [Prochilodus magdalenae]